MKKNLYIYFDQPTGLFQIEKKIKINSSFKNYNLKYISTEKINYSNKDIKKYYKFTPIKEILKKKIEFKNFKEFEIFLKNLSQDDILLVLGRSTTENKHNSYDLDLFEKHNVKTIIIAKDTWIKSNFKKSILVSLIRLINKFVQSLKKSLKKNNENYIPNFLIGSGEQAKKIFFNNPTAQNYIDLPSFWIDFSKKKRKNKVITYVDESIFYSRDLTLHGDNREKSSNTNKFLKDLNKFFDLIEESTNFKVVISCSKKHKKYDKKIFGNRKIFYGKTLDLISKSKITLGHSSEALSQAIYNEVPVLCLRHKTFDLERNLTIEVKSTKLFNKNSIFIENFIENRDKLDLSIDKRFYKKVLHDYFISQNLKFENFSKKLKSEIENLEI